MSSLQGSLEQAGLGMGRLLFLSLGLQCKQGWGAVLCSLSSAREHFPPLPVDKVFGSSEAFPKTMHHLEVVQTRGVGCSGSGVEWNGGNRAELTA